MIHRSWSWVSRRDNSYSTDAILHFVTQITTVFGLLEKSYIGPYAQIYTSFKSDYLKTVADKLFYVELVGESFSFTGRECTNYIIKFKPAIPINPSKSKFRGAILLCSRIIAKNKNKQQQN